MSIGLVQQFHDLKPYEVIRYIASNENGACLGFISRFHSDGRDRWIVWTEDGLHAHVRSLRDGRKQLAQVRQ